MDGQALAAEWKEALCVAAEVGNGVGLVEGAEGRRAAEGNVLHCD